MVAIPLTKVEELIHTLQPYMDQTHQLDTFTLERFKREARQNMGAYPWAGHIALGMIAVLEWDERSIDKHYGAALGFKNDGRTYDSFATALQLIGKYDEAAEKALLASNLVPENLTYLRSAISYHQHAGKLTEAQKLMETLFLRSPNEDRENAMVLENTLQILASHGISETVVADCNRIAFALLRQKRVPYFGTRLETDSQDKYIMFHIEIDAPDELVWELDQELGDALFDEVPSFNPDKYWIGYSKITGEPK